MTDPVISRPGRKPGAIGFWIGGLLLVLAVVVGVGGIALGAAGLGDEVDDFQRVSVREGGVLDFEETGAYPVYLERYGVDRPGALGFDDPGGDVVFVRESTRVPIRGVSTDVTYDVGGHTGRRLGTIFIGAPGRYELQGSSAGRFADVLAVGRGDPDAGFAAIGLGLLGGFLLGLAGAIVLIVSGVRRSKANRAARYPGGPGPGGPGWGAPAWGTPTPTWGAPGWAPPPGGPSGWGQPPGPTSPPTGPPAAPGWAPPSAPPTWPPVPPSQGPFS